MTHDNGHLHRVAMEQAIGAAAPAAESERQQNEQFKLKET
jgi:hypothetical protein